MKRTIVLLLLVMGLLAACNNALLQPPGPNGAPVAGTPTPTPIFYTVQRGDTLWSIAEKTGIDVETLAFVNDMTQSDILHPGDKLLISDRVTRSGVVLPTPTATPIPCLQGCRQPPEGCVIKAYRARLDGMQLYVLPDDEIYDLPQVDVWFCREQDAQQAGWRHWTPNGPQAP